MPVFFLVRLKKTYLPSAFQIFQAMKPPTVRRFMRTCKLCLEDVGHADSTRG